MSQLENPFFVNVIDPKIKIVNSYTFKNNYFQEIMKKLKAAQELRLSKCDSLSIVVDLWTNKANIDFIAIAACTIDNFFDREIFVLNMMPIEGAHTAENIKKHIEDMINVFDFDISKISSKIIKFFLYFLIY